MNAAELEAWLIERVAAETNQAAHEIDVNLPFARLGLDSTAAVALTGDLEDSLGITLDPTLVFEFPTIARLVKHLAGNVT